MPKAERPKMLNIHDYITTRHLALQHDKGVNAAKQLSG